MLILSQNREKWPGAGKSGILVRKEMEKRDF